LSIVSTLITSARADVRAELRDSYTTFYSLLVARDGERCARCGAAGKMQIDHIHPVAQGGPSLLSNLQLLCAACNNAKGNRLQDFRANVTPAAKRPRPYQIRALDAIDAAFARGIKRPVIAQATGLGKCLGKDTPVLMFDGTVKAVQDVQTGDVLMGPDSQPRNVLSTAQGRDNLYKVVPVKGDPYIVNEAHILSLKITNTKNGFVKKVSGYLPGSIVNISILDYLSQNKTFKHCAKGWRTGVEWPAQAVPIDPYFLGLWLGDGTSHNSNITTADSEIVDYLHEHAARIGHIVKKQICKGRCPCYSTLRRKEYKGSLGDQLRSLGVSGNKHVPQIYKTNSREVRLALLAGLVDSDGYLHGQDQSGIEYVSLSQRLTSDVAFIARSLGFAASVKPRKKTCCNNGKAGVYWVAYISGDTSEIPSKIPRKRAIKRRQIKNHLVTGIKVEPIGEGEYYGFEIDGDRLFLLGDFTVTHNTYLASQLIKRRAPIGRALFLAPIDEVVFQNAKAVQAENPGIPVGIVKAGLNQKNARIVIASLHTVRKAKRLAMLPKGGFQTVIVDEAHLNIDAYKTVIEHVAAPDALVVGLSATPFRLDGRGLDEVFDDIAYEMSLIDGIREGWLCEPISLQFSLKGADFTNVHSRGGDVDQNEVAEFIRRADNWKEAITEQWRTHAGHLKTAMFVPRVEMAKELADHLRAGGIRAAAIDGKTDKGERRKKLADYESGQLQVLVNVACLNTGWDSPTTECLLIGTLTASKSRYLQTLGRGTRLLPGVIDGLETAEERLAAIAASRKPNFLVMDLVGVTKRHKLVNLASLAGKEKPSRQREGLIELTAEGERERAAALAEQEERERIEAEFEARRVSLISGAEMPQPKPKPSFTWQSTINHRSTLTIRNRIITVRPMADDNWIATDGQEFRAICATEAECRAAAEGFAKTLFFGGTDAKWRRDPATEDQLAKLKKWRVPHDAETITKGEASDAIGRKLAEFKAKAKGVAA